MKKVVILKMGNTLNCIKEKFGDFEDYIIKKCNLNKDEYMVVNCKNYEEPPRKEFIKAIIITGSHSMVSDYEPWSMKVSQFLKEIINEDIPILGICYGHQLLADVLGGTVGYNPRGIEDGTVDIYLTEEGKKDDLLKVMPHIFLGHVAHSQTILQLPKGVKVLAYNNFEQTHAFVYKKNVWGVQYHPEFFKEITQEYIKYDKEALISKGRDYETIYNSVIDHKYGNLLLERFMEIVNNKK